MPDTWIGAHAANYAKGRAGYKLEYIFLHWIVGHLNAADATFQDPRRIASAHYGIEGDQVHQYVRDTDTAYHAGAGDWNWRSVGIEHAGGPDMPITEATIQTSARKVAQLCRQYNIPCDRVHIKKHNEVKATACPGTLPVDRIVALAQQHLAGGSPEQEQVTQEDAIKYEIQNIADVIGGDPHYDQNQKDVFRGHMERVLKSSRVNEMRFLMRDFLRDYGWKDQAAVRSLEAERDTFAKSSSQYQGETLRLQGAVNAKEDEIRDLHIALEQTEMAPVVEASVSGVTRLRNYLTTWLARERKEGGGSK